MKSKEKRMRKLRSVKLSAPRPKLHRMRSRIDGQVRITGLPLSYGMAVNPRRLVTARGRSFAFTTR
jgi:hypothetical protein